MPVQQDLETITVALSAPFDLRVVRFKPGAVQGGRALAFAYVDARAVQDRLDHVLGVTGWEDEYHPLTGGSILCRLKVLLGEEWIIKSDVGSPGEYSDEGTSCKAAVSDALKRAAVKFGVARYLYRLPPQWLDYDPNTRRFLASPQLPPWALPQRPATDAGKQPSPSTVPRHGIEYISEPQRRHLLHLLLAKGYNAGKLAERYGVQKLGELTVAQYEHAAGSLAKLPDRMVAR